MSKKCPSNFSIFGMANYSAKYLQSFSMLHNTDERSPF